MVKSLTDKVLPQLPKKWLSHQAGYLAHRQWPSWMTKKMIQSYANFYKIDVAEVEKPLGQYQTLGEFFSRGLLPEARPIENSLVHPCDGRIIESGFIYEQTLIQSKGRSYRLKDLLSCGESVEHFEGGFFGTYYLSPRDYHRVHMPCTAQLKWLKIIPGDLWPVNAWSVKNIDQLYAVNERVAVGFETEIGQGVLVMVGATNVGGISLSFYGEGPVTPLVERKLIDIELQSHPQLEVGQEFGRFHLGSSVILILDSQFQQTPQSFRKVKMGQSLKRKES